MKVRIRHLESGRYLCFDQVEFSQRQKVESKLIKYDKSAQKGNNLSQQLNEQAKFVQNVRIVKLVPASSIWEPIDNKQKDETRNQIKQDKKNWLESKRKSDNKEKNDNNNKSNKEQDNQADDNYIIEKNNIINKQDKEKDKKDDDNSDSNDQSNSDDEQEQDSEQEDSPIQIDYNNNSVGSNLLLHEALILPERRKGPLYQQTIWTINPHITASDIQQTLLNLLQSNKNSSNSTSDSNIPSSSSTSVPSVHQLIGQPVSTAHPFQTKFQFNNSNGTVDEVGIDGKRAFIPFSYNLCVIPVGSAITLQKSSSSARGQKTPDKTMQQSESPSSILTPEALRSQRGSFSHQESFTIPDELNDLQSSFKTTAQSVSSAIRLQTTQLKQKYQKYQPQILPLYAAQIPEDWMCLGYETHEAVRLLHRIRLYLDFSLETRKIREKEKRVKQALKIESVNEKENKDKEKEQLNKDKQIIKRQHSASQTQQQSSNPNKRNEQSHEKPNKDQPASKQSFNVQDLNCFDPITTTSILPLLSAILSKLLQFLSPSSHIPALLPLLLRLVTGTIQNEKEIEKQTNKLKRIAIKQKKKESKLKDIDSQLNEFEDNQQIKNIEQKKSLRKQEKLNQTPDSSNKQLPPKQEKSSLNQQSQQQTLDDSPLSEIDSESLSENENLQESIRSTAQFPFAERQRILQKMGVLSDVMHIIAHFIGITTMEGESYFPQFKKPQKNLKDMIQQSLSVLNMDSVKLNDAKVHFEQFLAEKQRKHKEEQNKKKNEEKKLAEKLEVDNAAVSDGLDPQWPKLLLAYTTSSKILLRLALHLIVGSENAALQ
ncbi:MAG: hypothetical protein EZS28_023591, partial [Streblomastix strix]